MSGTVPPIPPPLGANPSNASSSHVTNVLDFGVEDFSSWKDRFLVYLDGLEPYLLDILENGPFTPKSSLSTPTKILHKPQKQWLHKDKRLTNQDKRLKSIIISYLPNDVMKFIIKCNTAESMWNDLILAHEEPSCTRDTKITALRFKFNAFKEYMVKSSEFLADLNAEFHDRALLANQNRFYKRSRRIGSAKKPMDKSKETCFACAPQHNQSVDNKKDYNGKYKGLKDEIDVLTKKIDAMSKRKSEKGLVAESFNWDDESISSKDEGITRKFVLDYTHVDLHYVEDQRKNFLSKFNSLNQELSSYCQIKFGDNESLKDEIADLKKVIEKWISSKVTIDQRLTEQVPSNIFYALGGRGKRKDAISLKEVMFTKEYKSPSETAFEITSDFESECNNLEHLPPLLKLSGAEPIVKVIKKKAQTKSPSVIDPSIIKKANSSIEHLLLTLMEEGVLSLPKASKRPGLDLVNIVGLRITSQRTAIINLRRHLRFQNPSYHVSTADLMTITLMSASTIIDVTSVVALLMKPLTVQKRPPPTTGKPRIANHGCSRHMTQVKQYLHIYSKESGPKVVFGENSSGDTEGYGSVNYNVITFTRVANVNGLKHNLINISQLCDANFKVLFTKTQGTIFNKNNKVVLIAQRRRDVYVIDIPVKPQTTSHNIYTLVIVDEYSKYTWVFFLKKKSDAADCTMSFIKKMENLNELKVKELRSDNRTEFRNHKLEEFNDEKGISHNFSSPCTPKQNGVAERRNRTLIEAARTISIIVKRHGKITYDVFRGRSHEVSYFYVYGCPVFIHNHKDPLGKFDEKANDGFFLGYSPVAKSFRVFNIRRQEMEETYHVTFSEDDEAISQTSTKGDAINFDKIDLSSTRISFTDNIKCTAE
ncbi:retrovirus-related pol polyprotein from transposon TNT 1-94 [Tanacetum coccineum]